MNNHVPGLRLLNKNELKALEPNVSGCSALFSPNTGIIDSHRLIRSLEWTASNGEHRFSILTSWLAFTKPPQDICTASGPDGALHRFSSRIIINAAGLHADSIASMAGRNIDEAGYRVYPVKGEYFRVKSSKATLVKGLVYPVPDRHLSTGLGIHATKDLSGGLRLGPNSVPVTELTYDVDVSHANILPECTSPSAFP
jgi:L-2-hydroxyglutarate oxidase LhgO